MLAAMILAWLILRAWNDGRAEYELAKKGTVPPRMAAKYGDAAAEKIAKYGLSNYLTDVWRDYWGRRGDALAAARTATPGEGQRRVTLQDRLAAATSAISGQAKKVAASPIVRRLVEPVGERPSPPQSAGRPADGDGLPDDPKPAALAVDEGTIDEGTRTIDNGGRLVEFFGGRWWPVPKNPDTFGGGVPAEEIADLRRIARATPDRADPPQQTRTTGGAMTAPTGEAVNYETTVAELTALADQQRTHVDHCTAALRSIEAAKASIGDMQESYRASSAAAQNTAEHLAAKNLDGVTLANAGTTVDAMPAGRVDEMFDQLEMMEGEAKDRLSDAEAAMAATEANLLHIQATYGDAHATVAGNLGGDASFLDSGGVHGSPATAPGVTWGGAGGRPAGAGEPNNGATLPHSGTMTVLDDSTYQVRPNTVHGPHRGPDGSPVGSPDLQSARAAAQAAGNAAVADNRQRLERLDIPLDGDAANRTYRNAYDATMGDRGYGARPLN